MVSSRSGGKQRISGRVLHSKGNDAKGVRCSKYISTCHLGLE